MTQILFPLLPRGLQPDWPTAENPWLTLWRTFWLDLPLAWAGEMDRFLFRWLDPSTIGEATSHQPVGDGQAGDEVPARAGSPDEPVTATEAVALGLGCGDYSEEVLG
jgi:hypothetical protein